MNYEMNIVKTAARRIATVRFDVEPSEIGYRVENALASVWGYLEDNESAPAGTPFSIRHHLNIESAIPTAAPWDIETGFPILEDIQSGEDLRVYEVEAGECASTIHVGGYATLHNAYLLLQSFVEASGRQPAGPPREIYLTDPAEELDENNWRTEVQWPLLSD